MEAIIIPRKIRIVLPYVLPLSRVEMPEAPPLRRVLRLHWSDRTGNENNKYSMVENMYQFVDKNKISWWQKASFPLSYRVRNGALWNVTYVHTY